MSNCIDTIKKVINSDYLSKSQEYLIEEDVKARKVTIYCPKNIEYVLYKFDEKNLPKDKQKIFPFFNRDIPGLNKMADYMLFAEKNKKLSVFLIELKCSSCSKQQLDAMELYAQFILKSIERIINIERNKHFIFNLDYKINKIRIKNPKKIKSKVKIGDPFEINQHGIFDYVWTDFRIDTLL